MQRVVIVSIMIAFAAIAQAQRRPPEIGRKLYDPGPSRIQVRFALGEKAVKCENFHLAAKVEGRVIIDGQFASAFQIPAEAMTLPKNDALEIEFKCGNHRWHFTKVVQRNSEGKNQVLATTK